MLLVLVCALLGCGGQAEQDKPNDQQSAAELASRTVDDLLTLARAGDWENYVDRYYGESHKFRSAADRDQLVQRFENQWGDKVLDSLEGVVHVKPVIEAESALFQVDGETLFVLYRTTDGEWKFHL